MVIKVLLLCISFLIFKKAFGDDSFTQLTRILVEHEKRLQNLEDTNEKLQARVTKQEHEIELLHSDNTVMKRLVDNLEERLYYQEMANIGLQHEVAHYRAVIDNQNIDIKKSSSSHNHESVSGTLGSTKRNKTLEMFFRGQSKQKVKTGASSHEPTRLEPVVDDKQSSIISKNVSTTSDRQRATERKIRCKSTLPNVR